MTKECLRVDRTDPRFTQPAVNRARARMRLATGVVAAGLLSGCITGHIQRTLDEAAKIENECEAVDNLVPPSGQEWREFQQQLSARLLPAGCDEDPTLDVIEHVIERCLSLDQAAALPTTILEFPASAGFNDQIKTLKKHLTDLETALTSARRRLTEAVDEKKMTPCVTTDASDLICAQHFAAQIQPDAQRIRDVVHDMQAKAENFADDTEHLSNAVQADSKFSNPGLSAKLLHAKQEAIGLVSFLRGVTFAFTALLDQDAQTVVDEFYAPRVYAYLAKNTLDVIESTLKPLDRIVDKVDDKWLFVGSLALEVYGGQIQSALDRFYRNQVEKLYPNPSMQLAFASAACERLHDANVHPSQFAPFIERMFVNIDQQLEQPATLMASQAGVSSVRSDPDPPQAATAVNRSWHSAPTSQPDLLPAAFQAAVAPDPIETHKAKALVNACVLKQPEDPAPSTVEASALAAHIRAFRSQCHSMSVAERIVQCTTARYATARMQASTTEQVTDRAAKEIAVAACGANIYGKESAVGTESIEDVMKNHADVTPTEVTATARDYYTTLQLTLIQSTVINPNLPTHVETPPGADAGIASEVNWCAAFPLHRIQCVAEDGGAVRLDLRIPFRQGEWHSDEIDQSLTELADYLSGLGQSYTVNVLGFASSARAADRLKHLPRFAGTRSPHSKLLEYFNSCLGTTGSSGALSMGNTKLSCARAAWALDVLQLRASKGVVRDATPASSARGMSTAESSPVDSKWDRRVEIELTPFDRLRGASAAH